jgi:hypothetical protein
MRFRRLRRRKNRWREEDKDRGGFNAYPLGCIYMGTTVVSRCGFTTVAAPRQRLYAAYFARVDLTEFCSNSSKPNRYIADLMPRA